MYQVTVSLDTGEYLRGEDGKPLIFAAVRGALNYLAKRNYTLEEILALDFNHEEST